MRRKVSLENLGIRSSYKEQFPTYNQNIQNQRYSSQTNRSNQHEVKVQSNGGGLNRTVSLDNRDGNNSIDYSLKHLGTAQYQPQQLSQNENGYQTINDPLPTIKPGSSHRSNNHSIQNLNQTIDYQDNHNQYTQTKGL